MGVTLTDVLLFGKAQSDDVDNATLVIYRRNILRWSALGGYLDIIVKGVSPLSLPDAIADSLSYVKAFGGTEQRNLPDNYLQRQFIYMMDGSYLLTDIVPTYDCKIEMDFQTTSIANCRYLGARDTAVAGNGLQLGVESLNFVVDGFQERYSTGTTPTANTRYKFIYNQGVFSMYEGSTLVSSHTFTPDQTTTAELAINAINTAGTISGNTVGIYLYSFKVWNGQGELVMNLVPAVQKGTVPVVGFYDTVSKTFKTATAGTFAAGGEAVPTPDAPMDIVCNNGVLKVRHKSGLPWGYTLLDYIQSSGTQNIFLNLSDTTRFVVVAQSSALTTSSQVLLVGSGTANAGTWVGCTSNGKWGTGTTEGTYTSIDSTTKVTIDATFQGTGGVNATIDNETIERAGTTLNTAFYLFADYNRMYSFQGKVFSLEAYQNGTLVRNMVPCKNASNVIGMYDLVNGVFYQNAGTGDFVAGNAVSDPIEIYTDGTVETINVHGKNLFDVSDYDSESDWQSTGYRYVEIPLPNGTYTVSWDKSKGSSSFYWLVQVVESVKGTSSPGTGGSWLWHADIQSLQKEKFTFTVTEGKAWFTCSFIGHFNDFLAALETVQIEIGPTATDYVPYFNGGTATAEMLLKVGNYQDVQSIIDGVVTRSVGIKVLDGTEDWDYVSARFTLDLSDKISTKVKMLCNYFAYSSATSTNMPDLSIISYVSKTIGVRYDAISTLTQFKQFLADQYAAGTPVIIVYPLATPTTESVTGQTLQVTDGDNILEITQASLNGLELEAEYQAAVSLTIQEVQDANLDPNVQVTIN